MPQAIVYCDRCGKIISPGDISRGQALVGDEGGVCPSCAALLTQEQRDALRVRLTGEIPVARPPAAPARPSTRHAHPPGAARRMSSRMSTARDRGHDAKGEFPPEDEEQKSGFQKHIAIIGVVAGVAVGVAIALLVASGGKKPVKNPGPDVATPPTTPVNVPPPPPVVPDTEIAKQNLAEIKTWSEDLLGRYHDITIGLKQLSDRFPDTPEATEAKELLRKYEQHYAELADAELGKVIAEARARVRAGKPLEAPRLFSDFRVSFSGTPWFEGRGGEKLSAVEKEVATAVETARREALKAEAKDAVARAESMFERDDLDGAKSALDERGRWPQPWRGLADDLLRQVSKKQERIAEEARKERLRKEAWKRFIVDMNVEGQEGLKNLEAFLKESTPNLKELGKGTDLMRFARYVRQARNIEDLAEIGFAGKRRQIKLQWKGDEISGRILGVDDGVLRMKIKGVADEQKVPVGELAPANVVDDAGIKVKALDAAIYFMIRGDLDGARKRLSETTGEKASSLREEMDGIAEFLAPPPGAPEPAVVAAGPVVGPAEVTEGLVGWWKLDEAAGAGTAVDSAGSHDGTNSDPANMPGQTGMIGGAYDFSSTYVEVPDSPELRFTSSDSWSMSVWVYLDSTGAGWRGIVVKSRDASPLYGLWTNGGNWCFAGGEDIPGGAATTATWHHVVMVQDGGAGTRTLYVDTVVDATGAAKNGNGSGALWFGGAKSVVEYMDGKLDDVRIYNRALSADEVGSIHQLGLAGGGAREVTSGLAGWWKLDEAGGNKAADSSGKGSDGAVNGNPTFQPDGGRVGGALKLDGDGDSITVGTWDSPTFTLAQWMKWDGGGGIHALVGKEGRWNVWIEQGTLCLRRNGSISRFGDYKPPARTWVHLVVAYDGTNAILYVNGAYEGAGRFAMGNRPDAVLKIGERTNGGNCFNGLLDDVRLYDRALSAAEAKLIHDPSTGAGAAASRADVVTSGLAGWWKFDERGGNKASDSSGRGQDGNVRGAVWQPTGGKHGGALRFDGRTSHVVLPRVVQDDFSIAFWMRTTQNGGTNGKWWDGRGLVDAEVPNNREDFGTSLVRDRFGFGVGSSVNDTVLSKVRVNDGVWHHVAATREKATGAMKLYVDGDLDGERNGSKNSLTRASRITVGCLQTNGNFFEGLIDDVRIYERVLSGDEVAAIAGGTGAGVATAGGGYVPGLTARIFEGPDLEEAKFRVTRIDPAIDFNWGRSTPHPDVKGDPFSIRWTGEIHIPADGDYGFRAHRNDRLRLEIGGKEILERNNSKGTNATLKAGWTPVKIEYADIGGGAMARLFWRRPRGGEELVAKEYFRTGTGGGGGGGRYVQGLLAEYFAGLDHDPASLKATKVVPTVDFNWGGNAAHPDVPNDEFSCRFKGELNVPRDGRYEFFIEADDKVRLWVGDLAGAPTLEAGHQRKGRSLDLKAGWMPIRVDYVKNKATARCKLAWRGQGIANGPIASEFLRTPVTPASPASPVTTPPAKWDGDYVPGLRGTYYLSKEIGPNVPSVVRIDPNIDFGWGQSPGMGVPNGNFAVRWVGEIQIPADGKYTFEFQHDDGGVVVVDGKRLIDRWDNGGNERKEITLKKGWVPIEVLFNDTGSGANARFRWEGPGIGKQAVPASRFRTPDVKATAVAVGKGQPGGPKEPLPGETGNPGEIAPGLICEIFKGVTYFNRVGVRIDRRVDFHFEESPPDLGLEKGTYTMRWRGYLFAFCDGLYRFKNENLTLKLDGKAVPKNKKIEMERGLHKIEASGRTGPSQRNGLRLRWRPLGINHLRAVPSSYLFHKVPELGSMGPPAKLVQGLAAKFYAGENPKGRSVESSVERAEYDIARLPACTVVPKDQFSVRLDGYYHVGRPGEYGFKLEADDGAQLLVNDVLKIDGWRKMPEDARTKVTFDPGFHKITILHRESGGDAKLKLLMRYPKSNNDEDINENRLFREPGKPAVVSRKGLVPGIKCAMYQGDRPGVGKKIFERLDTHLEFDWDGRKPGPDVPVKDFSAMWQGLIVVPRSGQYLFRAWRRGGMRLMVGSQTVINDWKNNEAWEDGRPVKLRAGTTPIAVAFFSKQDRPAARIFWTGPGFMMRRLGDGDLVQKSREIKLAAPWRDPNVVAVAPPKPGAGKTDPGGVKPPVVGPTAGPALPAGNLVVNGGFEDKDADRKFAAKWTKGQWGKRGARFTARIDMSNPREGGQSALVARALVEGAKAGAAASLKLDPGTYRVSYWACAAFGKTATVGAHFAGTDLPENSVGDEWKQFTHEAKVGKRTLSGALRVWASTLNVRVWFDDVEVVMTARAAPADD